MRFISLFIILYSATCLSITQDTENATKNAMNTTRRALMQVPVIRQQVQELGEDALKAVGLTKKQAAYIAPIATIIQGRMTTKYIRGLRLRGKEWSLVPLLEYHVRNEDSQIRLDFFYAF